MSLIKNVFPNFKTTTSYNALINLKSENDNGESNSYKPYMDSNLIKDQKYKFNSNYDSQKNLQENFTPPSSNYAVIPQKSSVPQIYNFTGGNTISPNGMNLPQIPSETTIQPNNRFTQLFEEYAPVTNTVSPFQMQNQSNNLTGNIAKNNIYVQDTNQQTQSQSQTIDHNSVMAHMSSCQFCRDTFIKQYNLEQSKIYREELMELISYISFSILIIIIIDNLM